MESVLSRGVQSSFYYCTVPEGCQREHVGS